LDEFAQGVTELWGFKLRGRVLPNFQRPLAAKLSVGPQKFQRCKNVLEVLYRRAKFSGAQISSAAGAAENFEFLSHHMVVWLGYLV